MTANHGDRGTGTQEVYARAAPEYFRAGWQPLPLPPRAKKSPPSGFTGSDGKLIGSIETINRWTRNPRVAAGNLGLHLLHPFVGIDVDTHGAGLESKIGADTLAAAQAELGPLPPTLISTARGETVSPLISGIRVFRLPPGTPRLTADAERALNDRFGADIDVISQAYRYMVVWPSTNPDADDAEYCWYRQLPDGSVEAIDGVPERAMTAELPRSWVDLLVGTGTLDRRPGADTRRADNGPLGSTEPPERSVSSEATSAEREALEALGVGIADSGVRLFSPELATNEIHEWITRLRTTRRGRINDVLKDVAAHLWHFVPNFLDAESATRMLIEAQRDAWIGSGMPDDHDYTGAEQTISRTIRTYVPNQIRIGLWWVAVPDDMPDDDSPGKDQAPAIGAIETAGTGSDLIEFDVIASDSITNGSIESVNGTAGAVTESAGSGGPAGDGADRPPQEHAAAATGARLAAAAAAAGLSTDPADAVAVAEVLALREQRAAERAAKLEAQRAQLEAERLAQALSQERTRRAARRIIDEEEAAAAVTDESVGGLMNELLNTEQLADLPRPEWLIGGDPNDPGMYRAGLFYRESVARVIGAGGTYKTFMMISMASSVARGIPWFGFATKPGVVVYVMAEAASSSGQRIKAYELQHGLQPTKNLVVLPRPVQMVGPEWPSFVEMCSRLGAVMVVLDTQAKMTSGLEENSATDSGRWIAAAEHLRRTTGACVVLVHHTGHGNGSRGRGSSAAYAGIDTELMIESDGDRVLTYRVTRQKDAEGGQQGRLRLVDSGESIAVTLTDGAEQPTPEDEERRTTSALATTESKAQRHLRRCAIVLHGLSNGGQGATRAELCRDYTAELVKTGEIQPGKRLGGVFTRVMTDFDKYDWIERQAPGAARFVLSKIGCREIGVEYLPPVWAREDFDDDDLGVAAGMAAAAAAASAGADGRRNR